MAKPGRKLDKSQTNRRQKHELDYRARKHKVSKLAIVLADMYGARTGFTYELILDMAKDEVARANREARRRG